MKTIEEKIEVMQAFSNNKQIQEKEDYRWVDVKEPTWNWEKYDYRVKPKCVPFKTAEELLAAQEKHGCYVFNQMGTMCNCYVNRDGGVCVVYGPDRKLSFSKLFEKYTFSDGSQCGKEVES